MAILPHLRKVTDWFGARMDNVLTKPSRLLRAEGAAIFALSLLFYQRSQASWGLFALLFLAPDLSMLGYLVNNQIGAALYNLVHTLSAPCLVIAVASVTAQPAATPIALIWASHIGFDRLLGYGLKYPTQFKDTHLQRVAWSITAFRDVPPSTP